MIAGGLLTPNSLRYLNLTCPAITPTIGAELLTDGGLEAWTSDTNLTSWTEQMGGTSTVNREDTLVHGGTYAARLDVDALNSLAVIYQNVTVAAHNWIRIVGWARSSAAGKSGRVTIQGGAGAGQILDPGTTYTAFTTTLRNTAANPPVEARRNAANSGSIYFDDLSAKALALVSCLVGLGNMVARPGTYTCHPTVIAGAQAGLVVAYQDINNHVLVIVDRTVEQAQLIKRVAGVYTTQASGAITYGSGKELKVVVAENGTDYTMSYDGVQVGVTQAIADAMGLGVYGFSTHEDNAVGLVTTSGRANPL
jgi:hypothetical protein